MASISITSSGFFAFRTPLLPFDVLARLSDGLRSVTALEGGDFDRALASDREQVNERLRALVQQPEIREALFVASPSIDVAVELWLHDPSSPRARDVPTTLVRYLARMAGRSTPFGTLAGSSIGTIGAETRLTLSERRAHRRHTRLDFCYLEGLCNELQRERSLRRELRYWPNPTLRRVPGGLRYTEAIADPAAPGRDAALVALERTVYLDAVLAQTERGPRYRELVSTLVARDREIARREAEAFIDSLIDSQVLVSELAPAVTGEDPLASVIAVLRGCRSGRSASAALEGIAAALAELDARPGPRPAERYREVATRLDALPHVGVAASPFHVDLYKPAPQATLGAAPLFELQRAVEVLARITPRAEIPPMARFRQAFARRYGEGTAGPLGEQRMVPLLEALDEESGIGFGDGEGAEDPVTPRGAALATASPSRRVQFGPREAHLLWGLTESLREGARVWRLTERDLAALSAAEPTTLPDALTVAATLSAASPEALDRGEFELLVSSFGGPSGAMPLGRFCHGDPELRRRVEAHLRAEEQLRPEAVFAEIVHVPDGRSGNVLCRPVLRAYEIPLSGRSGLARERQIPLADLQVALSGGRIRLWSRRLACEVLPRLTSMHDYARSPHGLYRFLCALQHEGDEQGLAFDWGPLAGAPFLPRVSFGRIVLKLARWNLGREELASVETSDVAAAFAAVQRLRTRVGIPRWIGHVDGDNVLPIDLDNVVAVESWVRLMKGSSGATIQELFPPPEELAASSADGRYCHELVVPFVTTTPREAPAVRPISRSRPRTVRTFAPGSEWLSAKIYAGPSVADRALLAVVAPVVRAARRAGALDGWFFLRYADPDVHLRVRFRGEPKRLLTKVLPLLHAKVARRMPHEVWRLELDTYEREVERYGGDDLIELAEALFEVDSDAVLTILSSLDSTEDDDVRWQLAVRGCHDLLADLGLELDERRDLLRRLRDSQASAQRVTPGIERQLGKKFRSERLALESLWRASAGGGHPLDGALRVLARRSRRLRPLVARLGARAAGGPRTLERIAASYVHMHCNRILSADHQRYELLINDVLVRLYDADAARARAGSAWMKRLEERNG